MIRKIKIFLGKKEQFNICLLFFGILICAGLEMVGLGSIPLFLNLIINPDQLTSYFPQNKLISSFLTKNYLEKIIFASIIVSVFFIFKNSFIFIVGYFQAIIFRNIKIKNSKRLFQSYLNSPYSFHLDRNPAIITRNIMGDMELGNSHISSLINLSREVLLIFVIFILLLWANPVSSLIVFFSIGSFGVIFYLTIRKKTLSLSKTALYNRGRQVQLVNQVFGAIKDVKILAREKYFTNEFNNETKGAEQLNFFSEVISKIPRLAMEIFAVITILLVALLFISSGKSIETMIPFLGLLGIATIRVIPSFGSITNTLGKMRRSIVSFNLIVKELEDLEIYGKNKKNFNLTNEKDLFSKKNIEIKNVSYEYPNSKTKILKNISLTIKSGNYIAIIGKTGSGKSTLANIMIGLLEPSEGEICAGTNNIKNNYLMWQKRIAYIPQDVYLIDDTIKRNVAFGISDKEIDEEKVKNSIKLAQLSDFIKDLPSGLNTLVGDRGIRISGGQRQRLGIARALYRNSEILVLDEATSALDLETEKKLIKDIESLRSDFTLIAVTHRLSAIKNCDEVFLLSNGQLIDKGDINQLILRNKELVN